MIFEYQGTKLYYEIIGEGTPFLFLHGWGVDHHIMSGPVEPLFDAGKNDPIAEVLKEKKYKRIYIDLPGMGKSEASEAIRTSDDLIEVIAAFIDAVIGKEKFLLMGQSYGGYLSRGLSVKCSGQMLGMILWCPLIFQDTGREGRCFRFRLRKKTKNSLQVFQKKNGKASLTWLWYRQKTYINVM